MQSVRGVKEGESRLAKTLLTKGMLSTLAI